MRHHCPRPRALATFVALAAVAALPACASGRPVEPASAAASPSDAPALLFTTTSRSATTPVPAPPAAPSTTTTVPPTAPTTAPTTTAPAPAPVDATKAIGLPEYLPAPGASDSGEGDGSAVGFPLSAPAYSADAVVAALLAEPNLTLQGTSRRDLADGRVNPQLTRLLLAVTREHRITVSVFVTGHTLCVDGTNAAPCDASSVSMHAYGRAVDILEVDGEPVSAESERAWDVLGFLVSRPDAERPNEIGVPWRALDPLPGIFSDADHDHHLHVAFEPDGPLSDELLEGVLPDAMPPDARCATPLAGTGTAPALLLAADGRTVAVGGLGPVGDACADLGDARAVDVALTADCQAGWVLDDRGHLHALGAAPLFGDASGEASVALLAGAGGYRIVTPAGRVLGFGDRPSLGDAADVADLGDRVVVAAAATPGGAGYWLLTDDGGVLSFGDATFAGALAEVASDATPVGIAASPSGAGYWILTADGGIFAFGDAAYLGGTGGPAVAVRADHGGYTVVTADGRLHGFAGGTDGGLDTDATAAPETAVSAAVCA
jgi:hypothetical protein